MDASTRIELLERQIRQLKWMMFAILVIPLSALLMGAANLQNKTVRTEALELVNGNGDVRGVLKVNDDGAAYFELRDGKGKHFAKLFGLKDAGGTLYMTGNENKTFMSVTMKADEGSLALHSNRPRVFMGIAKNGSADLGLNNSKGDPAFHRTAD